MSRPASGGISAAGTSRTTHHDPVVVDWRAPIAAPFYRATGADPLGVALRRRFTLDEGDITAYFDEHLDDPDAADVASGIPDPVLAEIGAERTGAMREIVATIQAEQDFVIRAPIDQVLVVQGGPGTGKTAVALHRAAYLMFEHRRRLAREGVLVVGPNRAFLDYIANVLPSLGERSVRQCTVADLCVPKVEITGVDDPVTAARKGSARLLGELAAAALQAVTPPLHDVVVPLGVRRLVFTVGELAEWLERAADAVIPVNQRRQRLRAIAGQELLRRTGRDDAWSDAGPLKQALDRAWPTQQPTRLVDRFLAERFAGQRGRRRTWTVADQLLVDEANSILNGPPLTYGHVVVDEAQDHSAVASARDRAAQSWPVDDARRRRRPVDGARRTGALGRRVRGHRRRREAAGKCCHQRRGGVEHRLSGAGADPRRSQPPAAVHRCRCQPESQRAHRRITAALVENGACRARPRLSPARSPTSSTDTA